MENLKLIIYKLLQTEPFFAHFILNCNVKFTDSEKVCPTAGVGIANKEVQLIINNAFFNSLSIEECCAVLKHEVMHLCFGHVSKMPDASDKLLLNIAMDTCINQYITGLPKEAMTLDKFKQVVKNSNVAAMQTHEYYYSMLLAKKEEAKKQIEKMLGDGSLADIDSHDGFGDGEDTKDGQGNGEGKGNGEADIHSIIRDSVVKDILKKAASSAGAGNVPSSLQKLVEEAYTKHIIPWQQILRNFISRHSSVSRQPTRKRTNRRWGHVLPGHKKKKELVIGVCVDTSGSMSDSMFSQAMDEIVGAVSQAKLAHLVYADCEVQHTTKLDKNSVKKLDKTRHGNGGTAYQPAITKCKELGCDVIIYVGDMDTADTPDNPGVPFLWVSIGGNTSKPGNFGTMLAIEG